MNLLKISVHSGIFFAMIDVVDDFIVMIHSSGVLESNLGILIMYFPEVISWGVL